MNPHLLTEVFFEIRHSTDPSEYADITPAALGVRELRKLFFASCNYHDPEHVIIRTYSKLKGFNWNDQRSINDLNLFREAAIMEACGAVTFGENGDPLDANKIESTINEGSDERSAKRQKMNSTIGVSNEGMYNGGEGSARAATQGAAMLANHAVGPTQLQLTAATSKLQTPQVPFDTSHLNFQVSPRLAAQPQHSGYHRMYAQRYRRRYQMSLGYYQQTWSTQYDQQPHTSQPTARQNIQQMTLSQIAVPQYTQQSELNQLDQASGTNQQDRFGPSQTQDHASIPGSPQVSTSLQGQGSGTYQQQTSSQAENPHFAAPQQNRQESTIQYDANHQNCQGSHQDQQGTATSVFGAEATLNTTQTTDLNQLQSGVNIHATGNGTASQSPSDNTADEELATFLAD
ncbi:hypothetical protein EYC80_007649 [Monilinia laxa]|uniref:Uncharacterized protein n=1 Tax=Monilinia laxa TaxID=61186 RepID=A0A5N6JWM8_MONLA|nr:hypothetical protein EYC80_007649 [Monilinia laxa]